MAQCQICSSEKVKAVNVWILTGRREAATAKEFGFDPQSIRYHKRHHLPFRSRKVKKAETVEEKLGELEFELARLRVLAMSGEKVGEALRVVTAQRALFELELRMGHKVTSHRKLLPATPMDGEESYRVEFRDGQAVGVKA
jgi:hypothetical protein